MVTENPPKFRRGWHGLFALLALAVLWMISRAGWGTVERLGGTWPWDHADALLYSAVPLSLVALISFFALAPSSWPGTNSEVELAGPRAWRCGWEPVAMTGLRDRGQRGD